MGISEFKTIVSRACEIPCPVCNNKVKPKCPFYTLCIYRRGQLGIPYLCISKPEMCDFFKRQGLTPNITVNPSRRDE